VNHLLGLGIGGLHQVQKVPRNLKSLLMVTHMYEGFWKRYELVEDVPTYQRVPPIPSLSDKTVTMNIIITLGSGMHACTHARTHIHSVLENCL